MRCYSVPSYRRTAVPSYRLTAVPPYRPTALPPYRLRLPFLLLLLPLHNLKFLCPVIRPALRILHLHLERVVARLELVELQGPAGAGDRERRSLVELEADLGAAAAEDRSEEHTSELQSLRHLVCRL